MSNQRKMNISEIEPDKKIVLSKFKFSCDEIDDTIPLPLPQMLNFFMLVCGRPGSGKTTLILNLVAKKGKMYNRKFDKIFVFSPSLMTLKDNPFEDLPEDNKIPAPIRKTASHIIIFHTKNKKELDTIFDELIIIPQKDFYQILKFCFDKKNNFLYIDTNKGYNDMFHKCFNKLQFNSPDIVGLGDI